MMIDIQRANMWKRISSFVLDVIIVCIIASGAMLGISALTDYDTHSKTLEGYYDKYAEEYGLNKFDLTEEEYNALSKEEQENYQKEYSEASKKANNAFAADADAVHTFYLTLSLSVVITSLGILFALVIADLVIPLIFGNGQTIGKKIFGICLVRVDSVKVTPLMIFVRTLLGKYTVETMIPVMMIIMLYFNAIGIVGIAVLLLLLILQLVLLFVTRNRTAIHDAFAQTVVVDYMSQMIFSSSEELTSYKAKLAAEIAEKQDY